MIHAELAEGYSNFKAGDYLEASESFELAIRELSQLVNCSVKLPSLEINIVTSNAPNDNYVLDLLELLNMTAFCHYRLNNYEKAEEILLTMLKLQKMHNQGTELTLLNIAHVLYHNEPEKALIYARRISSGKYLVQAKYYEALSLVGLNKHDDALFEVQQLFKANNVYQLYAYELAGEIYFHERNYSKALQCADVALKLNDGYHKESHNILILKSKILAIIGKREAAIRIAEKAKEGRSDTALRYYKLLTQSSERSSSAKEVALSGSQSLRRSKSNVLNMSQLSEITRKYNEELISMLASQKFEGKRVNERHVMEAIQEALE